jgi:hypothetical protein
MPGFSDKYRHAIEAALRRFVRNGDDVAGIGAFVFEYGDCKLCGHSPIKWHYLLQNLQSHETLVVGSECIQNYQVILSAWGYKPDYVVFPNFLSRYTRWILDSNPKALVFNDSVVMRFQGNCNGMINSHTGGKTPSECGYVERVRIDGKEQVVQVNERGELRRLDDTGIPF